jgi:hypothetical protein
MTLLVYFMTLLVYFMTLLVCFVAIWYIYDNFGIFCVHLVYFSR